MLNQTRVLNYVKDNLGFEFQPLELEDSDILRYITTYSLREFSHYFPEIKKLTLDLEDPTYRVPHRQNEYYLADPQGIEILTVVELYMDLSDYMFFGHPPMGAFTHGELKNFALSTIMAMDTKMYSSFDTTFEFQHPNIIRISPVPSRSHYVTVEYERMQPDDLRGIHNQFQILFCEFALADIMIRLGRIRKKYGDGNLRTPFGEIPLGSDIYDEGKEKKREMLDKFWAHVPPNIVIDHG